MPKKTKKEKIIAEYHRKLKLLQNQSPKDYQQPIKVVEEIEKEEPEKIIDKPPTNNKFFLIDFKKSIFLTVAIIALEILFYFATIKNYLKLN
jgi:hypothetical protein